MRTGDTPSDIAVERNSFVGSVLTVLGRKADMYRES
jgi:hypothetical protein